MSVTIRLARIGRKNLPAFRVVVAKTKSKRNGMLLDTLGTYNPTEKPELFKIDKDKLKFWQERGALVTGSVKGLIEGTYVFKPYPSAKKLKREQAKTASQTTEAPLKPEEKVNLSEDAPVNVEETSPGKN